MPTIAGGIILAIIGWRILNNPSFWHGFGVVAQRILIWVLLIVFINLFSDHFPTIFSWVFFTITGLAVYLLLLHFTGVMKIKSSVKSFQLDGIAKTESKL